ncbi:UNVERIFIED_CONTAM: hypothetical protein NY100_00050 [Prevotella sp. 15_C9]
MEPLLAGVSKWGVDGAKVDIDNNNGTSDDSDLDEDGGVTG